MFFVEIWTERCPIIMQKNGVGEFSFLASFKSYDYFSEENVFFTACHKQTRQVIKISRHTFQRKLSRRHSDINRILLLKSNWKRT